MKKKKAVFASSLAVAVVLGGYSSAQAFWGVDVHSKVNTQEAGRDTNRSSYNRYGSHNIGSRADMSQRYGSTEVGKDYKINGREVGRDSTNSNLGTIRIGHDQQEVGVSHHAGARGSRAYNTGSRVSTGSASSRKGDNSGADDRGRTWDFNRSGSAFVGGTRATQDQRVTQGYQTGATMGGEHNTYGSDISANITFGSVIVNGEEQKK